MIKNYISYFPHKYVSKWLVFSIDLSIVLITFLMAYFIRFNFTLNFDFSQFLFQIPFILFISSISFLIVGPFKSIIRHSGFTDILNLFTSMLLMSVLSILFVLFNRFSNIIDGFTIPLSIISIHALLSFVVLSASRLIFKVTYNYLKYNFISSKKVLIYGAGDSGIVTDNALISNNKLRYDIVGFIDDDVKKNGKSINGIKILILKSLNQ